MLIVIILEPKSDEKATAPKFIKKLKPIHTPDGYSVTFECKVEGSPRPQITWFRQTAVIKQSTDFQMFYSEENVATLIIREVFPEDAGTFTCVAKNSAGFASSTTELVVELPLSEHGTDTTGLSRKSLSRDSSVADILEGIPPTFSKKPKSIYVDEGTDVTVDCRLVAVPEPEVKWVFKKKKITTKENVTITNESDIHMYTTTIKITKVKKTQEGIYEIVAKNREGHAKVKFVLKVRTSEKEPPEILEPLKNTSVREDETVILSTVITGNPPPEVTWYKNGKPLTKTKPKKDGNTYSITLTNCKKDDTAEYTVKAVNELGTIESTALVTVEGTINSKVFSRALPCLFNS